MSSPASVFFEIVETRQLRANRVQNGLECGPAAGASSLVSAVKDRQVSELPPSAKLSSCACNCDASAASDACPNNGCCVQDVNDAAAPASEDNAAVARLGVDGAAAAAGRPHGVHTIVADCHLTCPAPASIDIDCVIHAQNPRWSARQMTFRAAVR